MNELSTQIQQALPVPVTVKITDMTQYEMGISVEVYSNGEAGNTVVTRHKAEDGVDKIVAAHLAARSPVAQKKSQRTAARVTRQIYG